MSVTETFGKTVIKANKNHPALSRGILRAGWEAEDLVFRFHPHKESFPADQYLARLMMDTMLAPLRTPDQSVICSIFTPCELVQEAQLHPYNVEAFSSYISASYAESACVQKAEETGISDTLCSYHKTFLGAAENGLMPRPRCIVYTNVTCDANLLTFSRLARLFDVPEFFVQVPSDPSEDAVAYVRDELLSLKNFLQDVTGRSIDDNALKARVERSKRTLSSFEAYQSARADRYVPSDLVTPLYSAMAANILLGTKEEETYVNRCLLDLQKAGPKKGKHIYWMHTLPFWSSAVKKYFLFNENAQIVGDELSQVCSSDFDAEDPYRGMAQRLVYNALNGPADRRIEAGIQHAKQCGADGVIWFNHWGCKHTLGMAQLAKAGFEDAGLPTLLLDGDGCDRAHGGEGQTLTRIGAFLENLV